MNKILKICMLVVSLLLLSYTTVSVTMLNKKLKTYENLYTNNYSQLMTRIDNVNSSVSSTVSYEMSKSYLTKDVFMSLSKLENNKGLIDIRVDLSEASSDGSVYFMYKDNSKNSKWNEILLKEDGLLSYIGQMECNFDKEYSYKVVTKGSTSKSGDVTDINKYDFIPTPPNINYGENGATGEELYLGISLYSENIGEEDGFIPKKEDIKSVDMILGINGKSKTYPCEFYSDPINYENGVTSNDEGYRVYIPKSDYKKSGLDYIKMKITYSNGFVDTKDITNEIGTEFIN